MRGDPFWDPPPDDPMEVWGRRLGRGLAVVVALGLVVYLFATYLR
ncbi:hypothetical protein [Ancylobacter vacuolatus]|uniref:Uncharacterized protein n=1 Tax=Ancylobacter vacuolatus TaxID=223389 RepID=A0ABU0DN63_9HYPH|nr:hypothetical protein [Ancylobacter vacuolatus]MDQ0349897.1 hypothetical protein [Ancylobacter vacuolatus]